MDAGQLNGKSIEHPSSSCGPDCYRERRARWSSEQVAPVDGNAIMIPWVVVRTKVKCEKFIRDRLIAMGMEAFVPVRKRTAKYTRKIVVYEHPLITGYTFVRLDPGRRNQILALPYVQGMLRQNQKDCIVSEREIQWLQKVSGENMDVHAAPLRLQEGEKVIINRGQLAGMEGTILTAHSKHEVAVALESLGLQLVIRVDPAMLEKAWI